MKARKPSRNFSHIYARSPIFVGRRITGKVFKCFISKKSKREFFEVENIESGLTLTNEINKPINCETFNFPFIFWLKYVKQRPQDKCYCEINGNKQTVLQQSFWKWISMWNRGNGLGNFRKLSDNKFSRKDFPVCRSLRL